MTDVDQDLVNRLETARVSAMLSNDPDQLSPWLDEAVTYIHASGVKDTKKAYLDSLRDGRLACRDIRCQYQNTVSLGADAFLLAGRLGANIEVNGRPLELDNLFVAIWNRRGGDRWQLISWQSTPILATH